MTINNTTTILIATGALLFGGIATAAYMDSREPAAPVDALIGADGTASALDDSALDDSAYLDSSIEANALEYAEVLRVDPVVDGSRIYATVIGTEPVRETSTVVTPREVCDDVVVPERLTERDGNVGGTVAGALIGGLVGNQIGGGNGRKVATAAGTVAGGVVGNRVDRNHVGGRVVERTERQCRTENSTSESSRVTGYNVTYRNPDGSTGSMRMAEQPGNRIAMGKRKDVVGYDVTYRFQGEEATVRMDREPGGQLPVVDGQVVTTDVPRG